MIDINQRVADGLPIGPKEYEAWRRYSGLPPSSSYSSGKRRKRKKRSKRSKRKLSKSSSGVRIRRCVHRFRSRSSSSCRACLSLRSLVPDSHLFVVLLVRQWIQFTSVYFGFCGNRDRYAQCLLCLFREIPQMQFLDKVCSSLRCATTGAGFRPDIPVVAQRQVPMVHLFMLMVQFSDKSFSCCSQSL